MATPNLDTRKGRWTRRRLLGATLALAATPLLSAQAQPPARRSRLILLGTKGGPTPSRSRAPAANLLLVDGVPFLVDAPDGVARQLVVAGVDLPALGHVFITHHHSDHNAGLGALMLLAWGAGLRTPLDIFGPPPLARLVRSHLDANSVDIAVRMREEGRPRLNSLVRAHELRRAGVVLQHGQVRVTCALVDHYSLRPAFAYRFDTPDRSFVFSGDTAPSDNLIALARGADVLVHEVMLMEAIDRIADGNAPTLRDHLVRSHTTSEQVGRIAAAAGVRTLVLSHLVPAFPDIGDESWAAGARRSFAGEIIVGRDLMEI